LKKIILLIGSGNIGFRHFQGLLSSSHKLEINIFDKNQDSYEKLKIFLKKNKTNKKINFLKNLNKNKKIDLLILATNSKDRLKILRKVCKLSTVKNILFEKIVFINNSSFKEACKIQKTNGFNAWVNCIRREIPIFNLIKSKIKKDLIKISYKGNNWGMGSNSIHFIDLFYYLKKIKRINTFAKIKKIIPSKRFGFSELIGKIQLIDVEGNELFLEDSTKYNSNKLIIKFSDQNYTFVKSNIIHKKKNLILSSGEKINENVSKITKIFTNKLFSKNKINLTTLKETQLYHNIFFKIVNSYTKKNNLKKKYFT